MAHWLKAAEDLFAVVDRRAKLVVGDEQPGSESPDFSIPHHQASNGQEKSKRLKLKSKKGRSSNDTSATGDTSLKKTSSRASLSKVSSNKDLSFASTDNGGIKSKDKEQHKVNNDASKSDAPVYNEVTATENINDDHVNMDSSKSGKESVTFEETEVEENHPTDSGQYVLSEDKEART